MALNIEDTETEKLAAEMAEMTGETKEVAVREALREKKGRMKMAGDRKQPGRTGEPKAMQEWLETEIWPRIPKEELGKQLTKEEVEDILGFGPEGV